MSPGIVRFRSWDGGMAEHICSPCHRAAIDAADLLAYMLYCCSTNNSVKQQT